MTTTPGKTFGAVPARDGDVLKAGAINALLTRPIAVLPAKPGEPIRPFALGLWSEIRQLLRPGLSVSLLRKTTGAYAHSKRYLLAISQEGAQRHDVDGLPVELVSSADRMAARQKIESLRAGDQTTAHPPAPLQP